jgi:signal transduction histidine kinase
MAEPLKFRISSGLKNIIGKDLITDDNIAIFELVKNSYDAYAKNVKIVFQNIAAKNKKTNARILIIDDGKGMTYEDLINKWLFVGFSDKKDLDKTLQERKSDRREVLQEKRVMAGNKGIGRFSCDRLGKELKLYTKTENSDVIHSLNLKWQLFEENQGEEFKDIPVFYSEAKQLKIVGYDHGNFHKGTILEISFLNSDWNDTKLITLKRYLQRLINPAEKDQDPEIKIYLEAKEYLDKDSTETNENKIINGLVRNVLFEKLGINTTEINCNIDENGNVIHTKLIDKGEFIFSFEESNPYKTLKNINVKLFYLNPPAKAAFTKLMGIQPVNYGSVFLFKNRFRIHPYGNENDDSLGLDRRKAQGQKRFLGNRELMGRIEINGEQQGFTEVSSRDGGLIKNTNLEELLDFFINKVLVRLEAYVVRVLRWDNPESKKGLKTPDEIFQDSVIIIEQIVGKVKSPEKNLRLNTKFLEKVKEKQVEKYPIALEHLGSMLKFFSKDIRPEYENSYKVLQQALNEFRKTQADVQLTRGDLDQAEKRIVFLESITSEDTKEILGLQHQIEHVTDIINNELKELKTKIERKEDYTQEDLLKIIDKILLENQKVHLFSKWVVKAKYNTLADKLIDEDLVFFIKQYIENVAKDRQLLSIYSKLAITLSCENDLNFITDFRPLEISVIFDNLFNNSIKAKAGNVQITLSKTDNGNLEIRIKDDGKGIPKAIQNKIFDFGFTTTDGSGIGLYHVKQIVNRMNGDICINPQLDAGAEFIITVKK